MKAVKYSVFVIGVALGVTPIFHSAVAQSSVDSASVLLEFQSLRSEIADLRDMIERQQFEMRRLKSTIANQDKQIQQLQSLVGVSPQQPGAPYGSSNVPSPTTDAASPDFSNLAVNPSVGAESQVTNLPTSSSVLPSPTPETLTEGGQWTTGSSTAANPVVPALPQSSQAVTQAGQQTVSNGPEVVERGISASQRSVQAPVLSQDGLVDQNRAVGLTQQQGNVPSAPVQPSDVTNAASVAAAGTTVGDNVSPVVNTARNSAGSPILAIPSAATTNVVNTKQAVEAVVNDPSAAVPTQFTEDQYYDQGFGFLKQSEYAKAVDVFKQQLKTHPQGALADDAHYWIAEAMFISRKPIEARPHLRAIIDSFPQSPRVPDAMLKTAYIEQEIGNMIEARILFQEIVNKHPSSNAAIAAKNRLANLSSGQ